MGSGKRQMVIPEQLREDVPLGHYHQVPGQGDVHELVVQGNRDRQERGISKDQQAGVVGREGVDDPERP